MKYAEDLPYWKTGKSAERAITEAKNAIENNKGKITSEGFFVRDGQGLYFLEFTMDGDSFRFVEPVMKSRSGNDRSAKIQAAASLKHSIKARVNEAQRHGARRAFMSALLLPNGETLDQQSNDMLVKMFSPYTGVSPLIDGEDVVDGEIET